MQLQYDNQSQELNISQSAIVPKLLVSTPTSIEQNLTLISPKFKKPVPQSEDTQRSPRKEKKDTLREHRQKQEEKEANIRRKKLQTAARAENKYNKDDINALDERGYCPLYLVTENKNLDFIEFLFKFGADPNIQCKHGNTPFHMAFASEDQELILKFMQNGGDLNIINDQGETPLAFASKNLLNYMGLIEGIVKILPDRQVKIDNNSLINIRQKCENDEFTKLCSTADFDYENVFSFNSGKKF